MGAAVVKADSGAVGVLAAVEHAAARFGPDGKVLDGDVGAGDGRGAVQLDGAALHAVGGGALPVAKANVGVGDAVAVDGRHAAPGRVKVERVGVAVAHEVVKGQVVDVSITAVGLDHVHLVGVVGVDVAVLNIVNSYLWC